MLNQYKIHPRCYEDSLFSVLDYIDFNLIDLFSYLFKFSYNIDGKIIGRNHFF